MKGPNNKDFYEKVYEIARQIPAGRVCTYGLIASAAGLRSSARMVGWALNAIAKNSPGLMDIPAHRVVNRNGELTGKNHFPSPDFMREALLSEGVRFIGGRVDLKRHLWEPENIE